MSLQHVCLSSNLIGQNVFFFFLLLLFFFVVVFFLFFFLVPGACQEVKNVKRFKIPYSNGRQLRCGMSLENPLLQFHKI